MAGKFQVQRSTIQALRENAVVQGVFAKIPENIDGFHIDIRNFLEAVIKLPWLGIRRAFIKKPVRSSRQTLHMCGR